MAWADEALERLRQNPGTKHTSREIAVWIGQQPEYRAKLDKKRRESTWIKSEEDLINQIRTEISSAHSKIVKKYPQIKTTEESTRRFYYDESVDDDGDEPTPFPIKQDDTKIKEHELYPKLTQFLWDEFKIHSKRIDERHAIGRGSQGENKWLYPDLVGMENLSQDWHDDIKKVATVHADKKVKLWSFEVKLKITSSNVREYFFQAVSNSSWANYAYLVASDISTVDDSKVMKELRMLSSLHGVGVILLNRETPTDSEIKIPAQERTTIDWNVANRLARTNEDFAKYVEAVLTFYQRGKVHPADWDKIKSP